MWDIIPLGGLYAKKLHRLSMLQIISAHSFHDKSKVIGYNPEGV